MKIHFVDRNGNQCHLSDGEVCDCKRETHYPSRRTAPTPANEINEVQEESSGYSM